MSTWIIRIGKDFGAHWNIARDDGVWDTKVQPRIDPGDDLYFSHSGVPRDPAPGAAKSPQGRIVGRATAKTPPFRCAGLPARWLDAEITPYTYRIELEDAVDAPYLGGDYGPLAPFLRNQVQILQVRDPSAIGWLAKAFMHQSINTSLEWHPTPPVLGIATHEPTDIPTMGTQRREQAALRSALLNQALEPRCGLCGRLVPASFLVAGHLKPRSVCTDAERLDFQAVAMLFCTLGCDALYENNYVWVDQYGIIQGGLTPREGDLSTVIQSLIGRRAPGFTEARAHGFAARRQLFLHGTLSN